jgi:hypothetical protein
MLRHGVFTAASLLVVTWVAHVAGRPLPLAVPRVLVAVLVSLGALWFLRSLAQRIRAARAGAWQGMVVPGLLALAFLTAFVGLDHEIADRTWLDEGTYTHHASEINRGAWIRDSFVYPHLLYYAGAFAIWLASLAAEPLLAAAGAWLGIADWATLCRLAVRVVVAASGALTVIPVTRLARRLAPGHPASAGFAGAILALCPVWMEGAHLGICDVPAAALAACCLASCARWLDQSTASVWILAGMSSGLAASAKYPAGLVAVAILAMCCREAVVTGPRRAAQSLLTAGTASLGAFLVTNPSLLVIPEMAFAGDRGIWFGAIQYAGGGWLGVVPDSRTAYYLGLAAAAVGLPMLLLGTTGLAVLEPHSRHRLVWLSAFPIAYTLLLGQMNVAVERNLYPLLPPLAAFLGLGLGAWWLRLRPSSQRLALVLTAAAFAMPAWASTCQTIAYTRPTTRELARSWIERELTWGLLVTRDDYAPSLAPERFETVRLRSRFVGTLAPEALRARGIDLLMLADNSWRRFVDGSALSPEDAAIGANYARFFAEFDHLAGFSPGPLRRGPTVDLILMPRDLLPVAPIGPEGFFVPDGTMRSAAGILFSAPGQWASATLTLPTGRWLLAPSGGPAQLEATDRRRQPVAGPAAQLQVETTVLRPTLVVRVTADPGTSITGLAVTPLAP